MDTKIWFLLTVVAIVHSKDLSEGSDDFGTNTQKIFDENKKANPAIWRQIDNITINGEEGTNINKILVTDLREEKDGEAKIVEGGIGQRNVTIELKSPTALRGYDFHIEVYASSDNGKASTSHDAPKQEENPAKSSEEKKPVNAVPIVPISLIGDELSSTSVQPEDPTKVSKRQYREAEDKEKSNKQLNPHSLTETTTEVPDLKSTGIPTNKDKREDKVPEHGITNHPIHLQEETKMPESTARSIPTTEFKIAENKHKHQTHENFDENKKQTNIATNEKHANINYPQFNVREVTPNVPINAQSPAEEGHKRLARDIIQTPPIHPTPGASPTNQGSTTKVPSDQTPLPENSQAVLTENKQKEEHLHDDKVKEKTTHEHHNHNNRFDGRYVPDRFARNHNFGSKRETSTEINKVSTTVSQSSTPIIPRIIVNDPTTSKPETSTGEQVNTDVKQEFNINTNKKITSEEISAHKRVTRDTADNNNKEHSVIPTSNLKDSSTTTIKPEINGLKAPVEASEKENTKQHDIITDNSENKDKQRNVRGAEDNKEKVNDLNTSTTKSSNKEGHETPSTDKAQVQVPIELKSTSQDVKPEPKDAKKEKVRSTRDVIVPNSSSGVTVPTQIKNVQIKKANKSDEKVTVDNDQKDTTKAVNDERTTESELPPQIGAKPTQPELKLHPGKFTREVAIEDIEGKTSTIVEQNNMKNNLSSTSKPSVDPKKEKVEPKQPEKSLVPPQ